MGPDPPSTGYQPSRSSLLELTLCLSARGPFQVPQHLPSDLQSSPLSPQMLCRREASLTPALPTFSPWVSSSLRSVSQTWMSL